MELFTECLPSTEAEEQTLQQLLDPKAQRKIVLKDLKVWKEVFSIVLYRNMGNEGSPSTDQLTFT